MPFTDSFLLSLNATLTSESSGELSLTHNTDFSDNPQDTQFWVGSLNASRQLQAVSNPGVDNITITPTDALPEWEDTTAYVVGDCVQPTTPNGYRYRCTIAGTSHATIEPTWPTSGIGSTVTDGTVTWELQAVKHPTSEVKLALTQGGLTGATGGAALSLGNTIEGDDANAVTFWVRVTNSVSTVANTGVIPDVTLNINSVVETEV